MLSMEFKIKWLPIYPVILILMMGILTVASAGSREQPTWLQQARDEAKQDGYELITAPELKALYESGKDFTIIDVRPEYEYREGHLPHAKNLEFDPGDKLELNLDKQAALIHLLGPDKGRKIVFYCRSFA
ncbi:MAG: rhodanese-like domain-containing protein [Deltaproteobacteria bacterium]|nr:rhodanese-like domain-containing protein [Deltaproteobacteria bacterium]